MDTIANYENERQAFLSLLESECEKRILLFRGPSGTGKTALIMSCQNQVCKPVYHMPVQLRGTAVGMAEIFWRTGDCLGWNLLSNFTGQLSDFGINVNIIDNKIRGNENQIRVLLNAENPADREARQVSLTNAWFEDIRILDNLFLLIMDTYEQASEEMKDWISSPFLSRAANSENIRVAIAGQEIPEPNIEWGRCCDVRELYGVREAEHWLPVIDALGRVVPVEPALTYIAGICHAFDGRPVDIMNIIMGFPKKKI